MENNLNHDIKNYIFALLEKAEEAYLMSLEIINKPTIKYRTEGFCFFICNAWELVLKAFIIKKDNSISAINFKNNPSQTIGLEECMNKVFTSTTNNTKANLNFVRSIRNKATHNILPDYDFKFATLFQRCIYNFLLFAKNNFSEYKMNNEITAFVALSNLPNEINSPLALNPSALAQLKTTEDKINFDNNDNAITQTIKLTTVKKTKDADLTFQLSNDADKKATLISVPKDFNKTHPYRQKEVVDLVRESLMLSHGDNFGFNQHTFQNFCKQKDVKSQAKYCYHVKVDKTPRYMYSQELVEYILFELSEK